MEEENNVIYSYVQAGDENVQGQVVMSTGTYLPIISILYKI